MKDYFASLNIETPSELVKDIKEQAIRDNVPIITKEGLQYLMQLVRLTNSKNILEIGTAVGYTAINIALINDKINVHTIERDEQMFKRAQENILTFNLNKRIKVIFGDALALDESHFAKYDLIFIDAAKAQYQKLFEKYEPFLQDKGIIVCDNLLFHGLVEDNSEIESRNLRALVRKIDQFNHWLANNEKYRTVFLRIGDGMAVSERK